MCFDIFSLPRNRPHFLLLCFSCFLWIIMTTVKDVYTRKLLFVPSELVMLLLKQCMIHRQNDLLPTQFIDRREGIWITFLCNKTLLLIQKTQKLQTNYCIREKESEDKSNRNKAEASLCSQRKEKRGHNPKQNQ